MHANDICLFQLNAHKQSIFKYIHGLLSQPISVVYWKQCVPIEHNSYKPIEEVGLFAHFLCSVHNSTFSPHWSLAGNRMKFPRKLPFHLPYLGRPLLQSILVIAYIIYFGYPAVLRYNEKKTYTLSDVQHTNGIPAPSVTFCPVNKSSGYGWKTTRNDAQEDVKFGDDFVDAPGLVNMFSSWVPGKNYCSEDIDKCIAKNTYEFSDAIINVVKGHQNNFSNSITNATHCTL